ncbi:hypothetical protein [Lysobacter gummosus]|uniref:hypothetical protein n=1 Tax=Lysobacter gummosus TaxID=262324 RepID=UPI0036363BAD
MSNGCARAVPAPKIIWPTSRSLRHDGRSGLARLFGAALFGPAVPRRRPQPRAAYRLESELVDRFDEDDDTPGERMLHRMALYAPGAGPICIPMKKWPGIFSGSWSGWIGLPPSSRVEPRKRTAPTRNSTTRSPR